jgi:drug/metabolite transporter (DMT)-like permease
VTALLALISAVFIGGADFLGGLTSRTANGIRVATFVSIVGVPLALAVSVSYGADRVTTTDVVWSVLSGVAVGVGIGCFYTAMGRGLISIVAPVAAVTGAVMPVVYALANGERPGGTTVIGLVVAIASVAVVSLAPSEQHEGAAAVNAQVIALALASGFCFGLFYIAFSRVSDDAGLWPITIERIAASVVLVALALFLARGAVADLRRLLPVVAVIAVLEVAATVPLLLALQRGPVAVASVIASLYPVTTVLLAGIVLHERLSRLQLVGVTCALVAVALVSTG